MTNDEHKKYCDCDGYISWIHEDCLNEWLNISHRDECEFCNREYEYNYKINKQLFLKNINYKDVVVIFFIFLILILSFFKNNYVYADGAFEQFVTLMIIIYAIIVSKRYLQRIYNISKTIFVLEIN